MMLLSAPFRTKSAIPSCKYNFVLDADEIKSTGLWFVANVDGAVSIRSQIQQNIDSSVAPPHQGARSLQKSAIASCEKLPCRLEKLRYIFLFKIRKNATKLITLSFDADF